MRPLAFIAVIAACGGASEPEIVKDAEASATIESRLARIAASFVASDGAGGLTIAPPSASCVTTSASPNVPPQSSGTTTFHFADCSGTSGDVTVAWSEQAPTFHMDVTAQNLVTGPVTVASWSASGDVTASSASRTMVWQSSASGTIVASGASRNFSRTVDATIAWTEGAACFDIDGQASGSIDALDLETHAISFVACGDACPSSGSELRADDVDHPGVFVRVRFGAGSATYTNESGETFTFVPACAAP